MAFPNRLSERIDELRFGSQRSPNDENTYGFNTDSRPQSSFFNSFQQPSSDARGSLQRRFTTDSSKASGAAPFGQQYTQRHSGTLTQQHLVDSIREQKRLAAAQLEMLELQEQSLKLGGNSKDLDQISKRFNRVSLNGPVSEPTTPPEYVENGFSNRVSRSSRYSMNNLISPPGLSNRFSQSSSHITSPPSGHLSLNGIYTQNQKLPAKSMPGSRRGSDEEEDYPQELPVTRSAAALNRYSMPANSTRSHQRFSMGTTSAENGLGPLNTTSFLFDDNEDKHLSLNAIDLTSPVAKAYAQLGGDNTFPTLRGDSLSGKLSANSAALDLASSKDPAADLWSSAGRTRPAHQSMPHTDSSMYRPVLSNLNSPPAERSTDLSNKKSQRHSMGVVFDDNAKYEDMPATTTSMPRPAALQTSYSTNDVPTVKNTLGYDNLITPPKNHAEQQFHNHNVSLGRIPNNGVNNRQSRDMSTGLGGSAINNEDNMASGTLLASNLHAGAAPFGPQMSSVADSSLMAVTSPTMSFNAPQTYAYNMQSYNVNQMTSQMAVNSSLQAYQTQNPGTFGQFGGYGQYPKGQDSQGRGGTGRRMHNGDETRYNNVPLESYRGNLYELCKDQHGCRYLQRKLEDGNAEHIEAIYTETCPHIIELMTDPFGNYLCQKLFEHCNDEQRTGLINTAAPALNVIALNQHGTRALQKMIEFVNTPEQTQTIVRSLQERVVELVQDLNGNHVIQKCLNRLGAEKSQFIYDAVGKHCVVVGTHRHGCCVLQRCIDHAAGFQRAQLIARITNCAFDLVQDPFGNYVVQYILDLDEVQFTKPLCLSFSGKIAPLSRQKFSSNVIEKCLRTADNDTKRVMIDEMLMGSELEKMLRDSFANYVVQTAMDYADPQTKMRIVDHIRPILPAIKQTPHGRRIASKIMGGDGPGRLTGNSSGHVTPNENYPSGGFSSGRTGSGRRQVQIVGGGFNTPRYNNGFPQDAMNDHTNGSGNGNFGSDNYHTMNGAGNDLNDSNGSIYAPQGYSSGAAQSTYAAFPNGQLNNNYI